MYLSRGGATRWPWLWKLFTNTSVAVNMTNLSFLCLACVNTDVFNIVSLYFTLHKDIKSSTTAISISETGAPKQSHSTLWSEFLGVAYPCPLLFVLSGWSMLSDWSMQIQVCETDLSNHICKWRFSQRPWSSPSLLMYFLVTPVHKKHQCIPSCSGHFLQETPSSILG